MRTPLYFYEERCLGNRALGTHDSHWIDSWRNAAFPLLLSHKRREGSCDFCRVRPPYSSPRWFHLWLSCTHWISHWCNHHGCPPCNKYHDEWGYSFSPEFPSPHHRYPPPVPDHHKHTHHRVVLGRWFA